MGKENKSYRIRTNINNDSVVNFSINNTTDKLEILSLSINQTNAYKLMGSDTGIVAGRVLANGGFGVPNVKISVFIEYEDTEDIKQNILYQYSSTRDLDNNGVRYNLLPNELDDECHQNIGTFPNKRVLLDNNNWIEVFDKYYSFTTRTNNSGDYMIYGVPTGMQTIHMDVDLSDIGVLSQRPRDLIYKGYNANMFESPNKFKVDTNIDSLAQVITQDQAVYVYPFWGDTTDSELNASITRCDMNINYKFEPTCIFMGSVITDTGENAMSHKCKGAKKQGKMSEMITGEGKIEMIRKTPNGQIEQFSINGDNNINGDGIWCYQIPMNLDYVVHDEFGKMVMSDNPSLGLPTRARVRFRLSMAESPNDAIARKRARFLIPNNPHILADYPEFAATKEVDYEFGTKTKNENFRDLFWNNVYTVKSYIPRLQKSRLPNNLRHLGIKMVNHANGNNPMPFNSLSIKFNFIYTFLCTLVKTLVTIVMGINAVLTFIGYIFYRIGALFYDVSKWVNIDIAGKNPLERVARVFASWGGNGIDDDDGTSVDSFVIQVNNDIKGNGNDICGGIAAWFFKLFINIGCGITLKGLCETDDGVEITVSPGTFSSTKTILSQYGIANCNNKVNELYNCVENQLAQENEVTSFNFYNDWINGVVYLPLWYRKIKKRRNGDIKKDIWCSTDNTTVQDRKYKKNLRLYATNVPQRVISAPYGKQMGVISPLINNESSVKGFAEDTTGLEVMTFKSINNDNCYGYQCHKYARTYFKVYKGLVFEKTTMLGDKVYYYKPCDYDPTTGNSDLVTLFATDLVLLGSLNECDIHGIPQFFKALESTTYNMPPDLMSEYYDYVDEDNQSGLDEEDAEEIDLGSRMTENTGADWGNLGADQSNKRNANENEYDNGGLFYGLTCFNSYTKPKSCINLSRICEFGVSLDESNELPAGSGGGSGTESDVDTLTPDGFISYDEVYNPDYRSMFATLNANFLRTKLNQETGLIEYDFNHMYIDNFDGSLKNLMTANTVNGKTEKSGFLDKANYIGNYNLEQSSDAYLNFRYGNYHKVNGKKIYFYENPNKVGTAKQSLSLELLAPINGKDRLPRYENSFYFYFGLKEGKTAIDKFNTDFFSDCTNKSASEIPYDLNYLGNSWCPKEHSGDGYIAFNMNVDTPITIRFTNIDTQDVYECKNIDKQKIIFYDEEKHPNREGIPEEFENYTKYELTQKLNDVVGDNGQYPTVSIIEDNGTFNIEVIDAYDNSYEDRLVFELPKIGFLCDVSPFSCKNVDLMARFGQNPTLADTYAAIANFGRNYSSFDIYTRTIAGFIAISGVSEDVTDYRIELQPSNTSATFFGDDYTGVSVDVHNNVVDTYSIIGPGYLGYMENNGVITYYLGVPYANQSYKLTLTMLCDKGGGIWEVSANSRSLNITVYEDEFKVYLNNIDYDLLEAFRGGWNDAKLTSDGEFVDSVNEPSNPSVYNVNDIYGWDDVLNAGKYEYSGNAKPLKEIDYVTTNINEVLAICEVLSTEYPHNGKNYTIPGTNEKQTPYTWTDTYCYNLDETDADYYTKGTVDKITYTYDFVYNLYNIGEVIHSGDKYYLYEIVSDIQYIRYQINDIIYAGTMYYIPLDADTYIGVIAPEDIVVQSGDEYYHKEGTYGYVEYTANVDITVQNATTYYYRVAIYEALDYKSGDVIHVGEIYFIKNGDTYLQQIVTDSDINVTESGKYYYRNKIDNNTDIKHGTTYYTDESLAIEAAINVDYLEYTDSETLDVTRVDQNSEYVPITNDTILHQGDTIYFFNVTSWGTRTNISYNRDGVVVLCFIIGGVYNGHTIPKYDRQAAKDMGETTQYSMYFVQDVPYAIAIENSDGNITMNPTSAGGYGDANIEYTNLDCMSLVSYRTIIDNINEIIHSRGELTRQVAGAFRINDDETILNIIAQTKARPVKYLICGNSEVTSAEELYDYRANGGTITIPSYQSFDDIDNTTYNGSSNIKIITDGYVVDPTLETSSVTFKIPTLAYGRYVIYGNDESVTSSNKYYLYENGGYVEYSFDIPSGTTKTIAEYKNEHSISSTLYKKLPGFNKYTLDSKDKHPYYISVKNNSNSIVPPTDDYSNFNDESSDGSKNLTTTLGIHFYDKPLTGEFPMVLSAFNSLPLYPQRVLGGFGINGWYHTVKGYEGIGDSGQNIENSAYIFSGNTWFKKGDGFYYTAEEYPNDLFMYGYIKENHPDPDITYNNNDTVTPQDTYYTYENNEYILHNFVFEGETITVGDYKELKQIALATVFYKNGMTINEYKATTLPSGYNYHFFKLSLFKELNLYDVVYNGYVIYYRDYEDISTSNYVNKLVVSGIDTNDGQTIEEYLTSLHYTTRFIRVYKIPARIDSPNGVLYKCVRLKFGNEYYYYRQGVCGCDKPEKWIIKEDSRGIITYNNDTLDYAKSNNRYYTFYEEFELEPTTMELVPLSENERSGKNYYTYNPDATTMESYYIPHPFPEVDDGKIHYGIYKGKSPNGFNYYSEYESEEEISLSWKPINLVMPGFITGYLYNGIPVDDEKSNIKATLNEQEIKLDTYVTTPTNDNEDVYTNTRVKRVIYSEYDEDEHPRYGEYTFTENSEEKYQYAEVPLVDEDLVYTDGYGEEYRFPVKGTLNVIFDSPVIAHYFKMNGNSVVNPTHTDFIVTQTFYTSDTGYLKHQSLFYIFDCDVTTYPLFYYGQGEGASNLRYDNTTQQFYLNNMPSIFTDIENSEWVSKSKSNDFDLTEYIKNKYKDGSYNTKFTLTHPRDKFFSIACCDNTYTISPIFEIQKICILYNYIGFNLNPKSNEDRFNPYVYIISDSTRQVGYEDGLRYVEDFYYLNYYRFILKLATYNDETGKYSTDVYTQVCSLIENTAQKSYIRVDHQAKDGEQPVSSWCTAIKVNLSNIGQFMTTEQARTGNIQISDLYNILIQDKSGSVRACEALKGDKYSIIEFNNKDEMMSDYNGDSYSEGIIYYTDNEYLLNLNYFRWPEDEFSNNISMGIGNIIKKPGAYKFIHTYEDPDTHETITENVIGVVRKVIQGGNDSYVTKSQYVTLDGVVVATGTTVSNPVSTGLDDVENITYVNGYSGREYVANICSIKHNDDVIPTERVETTDPNTGELIYNYTDGNGTIYATEDTDTHVITYNLGYSDIKEYDEITMIPFQAFYEDQLRLIRINIPNSVTRFEISAFEFCNNLTTVNIKEGSKLQSIGAYCFKNCKKLKNLVLPSMVTTLGSNMFGEIAGIERLDLSITKITQIPSSFCHNCRSITTVLLPKSSNTLTKIGAYAFDTCINLVNIELPNSITSIGHRAFYNSGLVGDFYLPSSLTEIGCEVFYVNHAVASPSTDGVGQLYARNPNPPALITEGAGSGWTRCAVYPTYPLLGIYVPYGCITPYQLSTSFSYLYNNPRFGYITWHEFNPY